MINTDKTLIMKYNIDSQGNTMAVKIDNEQKQISPIHYCVQLSQVPDEQYRMIVMDDTNNELIEVFNIDEIKENNYYINYTSSVVYFHPSKASKVCIFNYYGLGIELVSASRIYDESSINGQFIVKTIQEIIDKGRECIEALSTIGDAVKLLQRIENYIIVATELDIALKEDVAIGQPLLINLNNAISTGTQLDETLNDTINVANTTKTNLETTTTNANNKKVELEGVISTANTSKTNLENATATADAKKTELDTSIANAQDDINTINSAGNRTYTIPSTAWVGTEPNLSYILEHNLGGENLVVGVIDNDTKLSSMPDYKSIDSMKIELYSTTKRSVTVTINKSAYTGSDSEWVSQEVIDARKGKVSLGNRLDSVDSQLSGNMKQLGYTNGSYKYDGAVVTIIDDDAYNDFLTKWKPLADEKGIKISIGFISSNEVGNSSFMSLAQVKALQSEGHNLLNHSYGFVDTKTVTAEVWENECIKSKEFAIENGFDAVDTIIYGGGFWGTYDESQKTLVKNIARKHFKYAINSDGGVNESIYDPMCVDRQPIDNRTLSQVKTIIDTANTNKTWLILYTHCGMYWQEQNIRDIIDYVKSLNIPIMTYSEAQKIKGYDLFNGDFNDNGKIYLFKDGTTNIPQNITSMSTNIDLPINSYKKYQATYQQVDYIKDTYFGKGGVLVTFRGDTWFSYQIFYLATDKTVAKRAWNETTQTWDEFYKIYNGASNKLSVGCSNVIAIDDAIEIIRITNTTSVSTIQYIQNSVEGKMVTILNRTGSSNFTMKQAQYMGTNDGSIFNKSGVDLVVAPLTSVTYRNIENTWFEV